MRTPGPLWVRMTRGNESASPSRLLDPWPFCRLTYLGRVTSLPGRLFNVLILCLSPRNTIQTDCPPSLDAARPSLLCSNWEGRR